MHIARPPLACTVVGVETKKNHQSLTAHFRDGFNFGERPSTTPISPLSDGGGASTRQQHPPSNPKNMSDNYHLPCI